jgi:formate hydrogenlyase transcriptional activator
MRSAEGAIGYGYFQITVRGSDDAERPHGSTAPLQPVQILVLEAPLVMRPGCRARVRRQDLFYRLNVFPIEVPPLRERKDDTLMLVEYFVQRYATRAGKHIRLIDKKTLDLLESYDWPGNIRELQNVVERAIILSETDAFVVDERWLEREPAESSQQEGLSALADREVEMIEGALAESHGRISGPSGAAAKLGIPRQTLESKIRRLGIDKHARKRPTFK